MSKQKQLSLTYQKGSKGVFEPGPTKKHSHLCLYHCNCHDGASAAWIAKKAFGDKVHTCGVGHKALDHSHVKMAKDRHVYVVDTTQHADKLDAIRKVAKTLTVLDHHETSVEIYKPLPYATVDCERCGAMMTWDVLFPDDDPPAILEYVDDYDRWVNELEDCKAIQMHLRKAKSIQRINELAKDFEKYPEQVIKSGYKMLKEFNAELDKVAKDAAIVMLGDQEVVAVRSRGNRTELGNKLAEDYNLPAVVWWSHWSGDFTYSLRATKNSDYDVEKLAKSFGGGGHAKAAGLKSKKQLLMVDGQPIKTPKSSFQSFKPGNGKSKYKSYKPRKSTYNYSSSDLTNSKTYTGGSSTSVSDWSQEELWNHYAEQEYYEQKRRETEDVHTQPRTTWGMMAYELEYLNEELERQLKLEQDAEGKLEKEFWSGKALKTLQKIVDLESDLKHAPESYEPYKPKPSKPKKAKKKGKGKKKGRKVKKQYHPCPDCGRYFEKGSGKWSLRPHTCQGKNGRRKVKSQAKISEERETFELIQDEEGNLIPVKVVNGKLVKI